MSDAANLRLWSSLTEGDEEGILRALTNGADVNLASSGGSRPLHSAAVRDSVVPVRLLLDHGAECNASDDEGFTPLMVASLNGNTEVVKALLAAGADPALLRPEQHGGDSALHMACNTDTPEVLRVLLATGADPNIQENSSEAKTPLHCAAALGMEDLAELLIQDQRCNSGRRDALGRSPASLAHEDDPRFALYLDLCVGATSHVDKLLISAVRRSDRDAAKKLLEKGAKQDIRGAEGNGSLLHLASHSGPVTELLLSRGAPADAKDSRGLTPLMLAAEKGATDAVVRLLAHRADPHLGAADGTTALHLAVASGDSSVVTNLLDAGVDTNAPRADGTTPMHVAALSNAIGVAFLLWENLRCQTDALDADGRTPYQVAVEAGSLEVEHLLQLEDEVDNETRYQILRPNFEVVTGPPVPPSSSVYRNLSEPYRGLVLIINYQEFEEYSTRRGSEKDVDNLERVFQTLGYKVESHHDLTLEETIAVLEDFGRNEQLREVDSVFVCILSHGVDRDTFCTSDSKLVDVSAIRNKFKDSACPLMAGKPKVFLFNFCRGNTREDNKQTTEGLKYDPKDVYGRGDEPLEPPRDMLALHATTEGFKALRLPAYGTYFVLCLCRILAAHAHNTDLLSMAQKLDSLMKLKWKSTTPEAQSFGFKKFFLNPRPSNNPH